MENPSVPDRIRAFNADRAPQLLTRKYVAMRESVFRFYRGTSHLFNHDLPADSFLFNAPFTWNVGDLHIENFGSFKADNDVAYFDLNDFDECVLAPALADLARLTCSLYVAADSLKLNYAQVNQLAHTFTDTYAGALGRGYVRMLEQESATGLIRQFLRTVRLRKRRAFVDQYVTYKKKRTKFRLDTVHLQAVDEPTRDRVMNAIGLWAVTQPDPRFFRVLDVAFRIAGTGSLGIERYAALVSGSGKPGKEYLLDLKRALPATLGHRFADRQPAWTSEAARVVEVQKRVQAASPALLHPLTLPDGAYVLKEMQPIEDKLDLADLVGRPKKLLSMVSSMGQLCAWGHLRSSGRQHSAIADALIVFGRDYDAWRQPLLDYARQYAGQVRADYKAYCGAYDDGFFGTT